MNITLISRLKRGLKGQLFGTIVQMIIRFAEPSLLLSFWGGRLYGEWLMITAIPALLVMTEASFSDAARREMMMRHGAGNTAGVLSVFQSMWVTLFLISLCLGALVAIATYMLPLAGLLQVESINRNHLNIIFVLLGIHMLLSSQAGLLYGGFQCEGCYGLGASLTALMQLLEFCGLVVAVVMGGGPEAAATGYLAGRVVGLSLLRLQLYRVAPWLRYGLGFASFREVNRLWSSAFSGLAFPLGVALNAQGMRLLIGTMLGPSAVAVFAVIRTLSQLASQPVAFTYRLMEAEMARAFGAGQRDLLLHLFRHLCSVSVWGALIMSLTLAIVGEKLLEFWTDGHTPMNWPVFILLLLAVVANSVWNAAIALPFVTNRYQKISIGYALIYGGGAILSAFFAIYMVGFVGTGAGILLADVAMIVFVVPIAIRQQGETWLTWVRAVLTPPLYLLKYI